MSERQSKAFIERLLNTQRLMALGLVLITLLLVGCGSNTIAIDAPADSAAMLIEGTGNQYRYYALEESPPANWEDVSSGGLWICSQDERPPLIPEGIASRLDGGGFPAGTKLNLEWSDQPGASDSSQLGIEELIVTVGVSYEGCTRAALEEMENSSALLLTDTDGTFDGKDQLVPVEFD